LIEPFIKKTKYVFNLSNSVDLKESSLKNKNVYFHFLVFCKRRLYNLVFSFDNENLSSKFSFTFSLIYAHYLFFLKEFFLDFVNKTRKKTGLKVRGQKIQIIVVSKQNNINCQKFYLKKLFENYNFDLGPTYKSQSKIAFYKIAKMFSLQKGYKLDDIQVSQILLIIKSLFKAKGYEVNPLTVVDAAINNVKPLYNIIYNQLGRKKVGYLNYIYIDQIRQSIAIKWILKGAFINDISSRLKSNKDFLEYKIAFSFLDTFFKRGYAFKQFTELTKLTLQKDTMVNRGYILRPTKSKSFLKYK
jgi:ribosomal protein S7